MRTTVTSPTWIPGSIRPTTREPGSAMHSCAPTSSTKSATTGGGAPGRENSCALESIGKSYEGRDIWLVTVTNTETGAHLHKPGFLIEANIHSMEWTGCTAALHLIHRLLTGHGTDDLVTRALDTRVFYVIPRLKPDGAERG